MSILRYSIKKPVSVAVFVIMILLFGIIGLTSLPVQLTPDVDLPEITITTTWAGATPYDIEQEIIEDQEDALKGLQNLVSMESSSYNDYGTISLVFKVGVDIDNALLRVANKLDEVSNYPENADKPIMEAAGASSSPVIWILLKTTADNPETIDHYRTFYDNEIEQQLERIDGIGSLFVGGGTEDQLQIVADRQKMARSNITINQMVDSVQRANKNTSAGTLGIGNKDYRIRTVSRFQNDKDPLDVVLEDDGTKRVLLSDVATTQKGYAKKTVAIQSNGKLSIVIGVRKEKGANVIDMTRRTRQVVDDLNAGILAEKGLYLDWVYDQTPYINTAISIVKNNALIGGILAVMVLLLFLRSVSATAITAIAIPISVIGTFISLWLFHRNINVVSLAGISFAIGMLVDNAIVVLENIDRHRQMGKKAFDASLDGAQEVFGAVLASTATTVAVFLPVIFIEQEAGQLFRDIAIAITFAILLSMLVSLVVIPCLANLVFSRRPLAKEKNDVIGRQGQKIVNVLMKLSNLSLRSLTSRILSISLFTFAAILITWILLPKSEYLPQGNRNLILNILIPPPGLSVEKRSQIGEFVYQEALPYSKEDGKDGVPQIKNLFFVATPDLNIIGAISTHETEAKKLMPLMSRIMNSIPDMIGVSLQSGIFENDIGEGRAVEINITGTNLNTLVSAGRTLYGGISQALTSAQIRPIPSLEISYPEVNIIADKQKLVANGLDETTLGQYIDILMDGRQISDYMPDGMRKVDLVLKASDSEIRSPEDILNSTIVNGHGELIRVGDVARADYSQGMTQVDHYERRRNITLQVTPPAQMPLQQATETIEAMVNKLTSDGTLGDVKVFIGGNADKLVETREALQWNLLLALVLTYLLMAVLFENFFYPLIIMFSVPLAAAGGFLGLTAVNLFVAPQGFDILTMLGFIILIGTVVNNAILIVHQSLNNVRYEGLTGIPAISESVRTRIRPIFMSTTTSLFALLPLVLSTGAGSELYRGIGSVLLGGLLVSTLFTLFVIPALLAFFIHNERAENAE